MAGLLLVTGRIVFETERLRFRELGPADLLDLAALYADPEVMRYFEGTRTRQQAAQQIQESRRYYERYDFHLWATLRKPNDLFIGRCGLMPQTVEGQSEVEVAYMIARRFWGQGLGTEAARGIAHHGFTRHELARLVSIIHPKNGASIRVAQKNGMHFEKDVQFESFPCVLYAMNRPPS